MSARLMEGRARPGRASKRDALGYAGGGSSAVDVETLIAELRRPEAYGHRVDAVSVIQTHASVVFLAGDEVYKVKKPCDFGFLDYSTLERRLQFCRAEVELNRRLAPDVYLGVEPLTWHKGHLRVGGTGLPVEYAVHMRRLEDADTLRARWRRGELSEGLVSEVARTVAAFHASRTPDPDAARWSTLAEVSRNHRDNFVTLAAHAGNAIPEDLHARLERSADRELRAHAALIEARAGKAIACDGHGDLRTDHVYVHDDVADGRRIDIVDCIEFNARYRGGDPISDIAFLAVDLAALGARQLAETLVDAYMDASGDPSGAELLPLYRGYRATVRAKVEAIRSTLSEVPDEERAQAWGRARAWAIVALGELEPPDRRPGLVLVAGLPASGKSTVAATLAKRGFQWVRADEVRKRLAGVRPASSAAAAVDQGIYSKAWSDRTYRECLDVAKRSLGEGARVVVDATLLTRARREPFLRAATKMGVRTVLIVCAVAEPVTRQRLESREAGPSDAGYEVYRALSERWEPPTAREGAWGEVRTDSSKQEADAEVLAHLVAAGLA